MRAARLIGLIFDFIGSVSVSEGLERVSQRQKVGSWEEKEYGNGGHEERTRKRNIKSSMVFSHYLNRDSLISFPCFHAWHRFIKKVLLICHVIGDMENPWSKVFPQLASCWGSTRWFVATPQDPWSDINYMCKSYVWIPLLCQFDLFPSLLSFLFNIKLQAAHVMHIYTHINCDHGFKNVFKSYEEVCMLKVQSSSANCLFA